MLEKILLLAIIGTNRAIITDHRPVVDVSPLTRCWYASMGGIADATRFWLVALLVSMVTRLKACLGGGSEHFSTVDPTVCEKF